jgi:hypothetical protein
MPNWVGGRTISVDIEKSKRLRSRQPKRRWYARWWAWCLWVLLGILLILLVASLWAWTQRYALMENYVKAQLAEAGFDAELKIGSVTQSEAHIGDIRLKKAGQEFLRIRDLRANYDSADIRDIQIKRVELEGVDGRLSLGSDWTPADSWVKDLFQGSSGSGGDDPVTTISENGFGLKDARLTFLSPLGEQTVHLEADVATSLSYQAEVTLPLSNLTYGDIAAQGEGSLVLNRSGEEISVRGQAETKTLSNSKIRIENARLEWDGNLSSDFQTYQGTALIDGQKISGDSILAEAARIGWDGTVDQKQKNYAGRLTVEGHEIASDLFAADAAEIEWAGDVSTLETVLAKGQWSVDAKRARTPRRARAEELADTLSLFPAVSVVPVTEHFAPELKQIVMEFLLGADVKGRGAFEFGPSGFLLSPEGPVLIETRKNSLRLLPRAYSDFFLFDASKENILAKMDAEFRHPVGLNLTNIQLTAKSKTGVRLDEVETFSANFKTAENWRTLAEDDRPIRLGPLAASMKYKGGARPRRLTIETALDYDGSLPGGSVMGLNLDGTLDVRLYASRQELDFTPRLETVVTLDRLVTPTDWVGENIQFTLPSTENLFTRTPAKSILTAILKKSDFVLTKQASLDTAAQRLDLKSESMALEGILWPDKTQDWAVGFNRVHYASETLPGPGTTASAPEAKLSARLSPGATPKITLNSTSITAETPLARVSNFEIALVGTPDAYVVDHKGGTVDVIGSDFAASAKAAGIDSFPADGRVEFIEGRFVGQTKLVVAKANNADVDVRYEYGNGAGQAEIDIPSILFEPKGLQPQSLVPAFRGKIARVDGEARAILTIGFANGALTSSGGTVELLDMDVGTAPGPVQGLNTTMQFSSLWPLETDGPQQLTLESFNPGLPLDDGVVTFNLVPDGLKVDAADWPIGSGAFSLDPFIWKYDAPENRVIMRVKNVALGDFLNGFGDSRIEATGKVEGVFPIVVRGVQVLIEKGRVSVPDGGVIKYDPGPSVPTYTEEEAVAILRQNRTTEYASLAQDALREFGYRELSASLDGPLDGDVEIGLIFDGSNAKVLNRQPFRFDISVRGELFNIARSFNSNAQVKAEILRQNGKLPEGTVIGQ